MAITKMPSAEVSIDDGLVRGLLRAQHPDLAGLSLEFLSEGWDNVMYRLGDELLVRLPRRHASVVLIESEQRWLPSLSPRLPLEIPVPIRLGVGGEGYPWPWSVVAWVAGARGSDSTFADPGAQARRLGRFLAALHVEAPDDAPRNDVRGVPLAARDEMTRDRLDELRDLVETEALHGVWERGLAAATWAGPPLWIHGDLHAANLIVDRGEIVSVIDWGDITSGDPATDLAAAWMLFGAEDRATFRDAAGDVDDATWQRSRAWALSLALAYLLHSADNPAMGAIGATTLDAILGDE